MKALQSTGTILILVLLYLLIASLFVLNSLEASQLEIKMAQNQQVKATLFYAAERGLVLAEKALNHPEQLSCLVPHAAMDEYSKRNELWWRSRATCSIKDSEAIVAFVVEQLEHDPCARIKDSKLIALYYRITVYSELVSGSFPIILQSTFAQPSKSVEKCHSRRFVTIIPGRQSWYELT